MVVSKYSLNSSADRSANALEEGERDPIRRLLRFGLPIVEEFGLSRWARRRACFPEWTLSDRGLPGDGGGTGGGFSLLFLCLLLRRWEVPVLGLELPVVEWERLVRLDWDDGDLDWDDEDLG